MHTCNYNQLRLIFLFGGTRFGNLLEPVLRKEAGKIVIG